MKKNLYMLMLLFLFASCKKSTEDASFLGTWEYDRSSCANRKSQNLAPTDTIAPTPEAPVPEDDEERATESKYYEFKNTDILIVKITRSDSDCESKAQYSYTKTSSTLSISNFQMLEDGCNEYDEGQGALLEATFDYSISGDEMTLMNSNSSACFGGTSKIILKKL